MDISEQQLERILSKQKLEKIIETIDDPEQKEQIRRIDYIIRKSSNLCTFNFREEILEQAQILDDARRSQVLETTEKLAKTDVYAATTFLSEFPAIICETKDPEIVKDIIGIGIKITEATGSLFGTYYFKNVPHTLHSIKDKTRMQQVLSTTEKIIEKKPLIATNYFILAPRMLEHITDDQQMIQIAELAQNMDKNFGVEGANYLRIVPELLKESICVAKTARIWEKIDRQLERKTVTKLKNVLNSDENDDLRIETIDLYSVLNRVMDITPPEDSQTWKPYAEETLKKKVKETFNITNLKEYRTCTLLRILESDFEDKEYAEYAEDENTGDYDQKSAIRDILRGDVHKSFEKGKIYKSIKRFSTTDGQVSPQEATQNLVIALLGSKDPEKTKISEEFFSKEKEKLRKAKQYFSSSIGKKKFFNKNKKSIKKVMRGDLQAGKEIINNLKKHIRNGSRKKSEYLSDLLTMVETAYSDRTIYTQVDYRSQEATIYDLFNNQTLYCCAFHPEGASRHAAALYIMDPNIALIPATPKKQDGTYDDPLGIAISFFAKTKIKTQKHKNRNVKKQRKKDRILVVDGVEGGDDLPKTWKQDFYETLTTFAKENRCKKIFYNANTTNSTPQRFIEFIKTEKKLEKIRVKIKKIGMCNHIKKYRAKKQYFDCFDEWNVPRGTIDAYVQTITE